MFVTLRSGVFLKVFETVPRAPCKTSPAIKISWLMSRSSSTPNPASDRSQNQPVFRSRLDDGMGRPREEAGELRHDFFAFDRTVRSEPNSVPLSLGIPNMFAERLVERRHGKVWIADLILDRLTFSAHVRHTRPAKFCEVLAQGRLAKERSRPVPIAATRRQCPGSAAAARRRMTSVPGSSPGPMPSPSQAANIR